MVLREVGDDLLGPCQSRMQVIDFRLFENPDAVLDLAEEVVFQRSAETRHGLGPDRLQVLVASRLRLGRPEFRKRVEDEKSGDVFGELGPGAVEDGPSEALVAVAAEELEQGRRLEDGGFLEEQLEDDHVQVPSGAKETSNSVLLEEAELRVLASNPGLEPVFKRFLGHGPNLLPKFWRKPEKN